MVKNKKDIWLWAGDTKIVEKFKELKISEAIFFSLFIFFFSTRYSWQYISWYFLEIPENFIRSVNYILPYWWIAVLAVLFVSKFNLFFGAFNFSSVSWKDFLIINKYIYLFFCLSLAIALCVVLTFSDSWMGIRRAIDVMVSGSALLNKFYYIVKEEVLYRFLLYYSLNRLFGRGTAFFCTVTLFSLMHHTHSFYYPFARSEEH